MYKKQDKKMITMDILDILRRHSDVNHPLKQDDILKYLQDEYIMDVDRRAVSNNLERLIEEDEFDINYNTVTRGKGKDKNIVKTDFYINHDFDESELRLIIDSLLFSKYIPYSQCKNLIEKLEGLASEHFKTKIKHIKTLPETLPRNVELFTTIEVVDEALEKGRKIRFNYAHYDLNKKLVMKCDKDGNPKEYVVTPFQMVASNSRYYLICNIDGKDDLGIYKIDKIMNAEVCKEVAKSKNEIKEIKDGFDLPKHMMEHIYMNIGESDNVTFEFDSWVLDDVLEWFGKDVKIAKKDDNTYICNTKVNLKAMKYWAMQYSESIKVTSPKKLVDSINKLLKDAIKKYK